MLLYRSLLILVRAFIRARSQLAIDSLALRHQHLVLQRSVKQPRLDRSDRLLWVFLSRIWNNWRGKPTKEGTGSLTS